MHIRSIIVLLSAGLLLPACGGKQRTDMKPPVANKAAKAAPVPTTTPPMAPPKDVHEAMSQNLMMSLPAGLLGLEIEHMRGLDWPCATTVKTPDGSFKQASIEYDDKGMPTIGHSNYMLVDLMVTGKHLFVYDGQGRFVGFEGCMDQDKCQATTYEERYAYDEEGAVVGFRNFFMRDGGFAGEGGMASSVTYDMEGQRTVKATEESGLGGDGDPYKEMLLPSESVSTLVFNEPMTWLSHDRDDEGISLMTDFNENGLPTRRLSTHMGEEGQILTSTERRFTYNKAGMLVGRTYAEHDLEDGALKYTAEFVYSYDPAEPRRITQTTLQIGQRIWTINADYSCHDAPTKATQK